MIISNIKNFQSVYQTEKQISELGDKLDEEAKGRLEAGVQAVKDAIASENLAQMKESTEALNKLWHEEAGKMYAQSQAAEGAPADDAGAGPAEGDTPESEEAIEADFEVVDEEKK